MDIRASRLRSAMGSALLAAILALGGTLAEPAAAGPSAPTVRAVAPRPDAGLRARANRPPAASDEIYGYLPYWQVNDRTARRIDYRLVTTIAFFAVPVRGDGTLNRTSAGYRAYVSRAARAITNAAHANGVRVVPTFQLFDGGQLRKMRHLLSSRAAQARFIREAIALMVRRRADGANVDFEPVPRSLAAPFAAFIGRFGRAVHARFPRSQLVVATPALASIRLIERLAPAVDRFFIMAYDYRWSGSRIPGAVAPLSGRSLNVAATVRRYQRHAPAGKLKSWACPYTATRPRCASTRCLARVPGSATGTSPTTPSARSISRMPASLGPSSTTRSFAASQALGCGRSARTAELRVSARRS